MIYEEAIVWQRPFLLGPVFVLMSASVTPCLSRVYECLDILYFIAADSEGIALLAVQVNFLGFAGVNAEFHRF